MRREVKILLGTMALGATVAWGDRIPAFVSDMETFQIATVDVSGTHFLSVDDVMVAMGGPRGASVWRDVESWEDALREHPMIKAAVVERRVPDALVVSIEERVPVALVPTPTIEPVDADGVRLALDPAEHRLDLPIVTLTRAPAEGSRFLPREGRELVREVGRIHSVHESFLQRVSDVRWGPRRTLIAHWGEPGVDFLLPVGLPSIRFQEGVSALSEAVSVAPGSPPSEIDLRFADQVVVRRILPPTVSSLSTIEP